MKITKARPPKIRSGSRDSSNNKSQSSGRSSQRSRNRDKSKHSVDKIKLKTVTEANFESSSMGWRAGHSSMSQGGGGTTTNLPNLNTPDKTLNKTQFFKPNNFASEAAVIVSQV